MKIHVDWVAMGTIYFTVTQLFCSYQKLTLTKNPTSVLDHSGLDLRISVKNPCLIARYSFSNS